MHLIIIIATLISSALGDAWSNQVLAAHNSARAQYGVRPVTWSDTLYSEASQLASRCTSRRPSNAPFGINVFATNANAGIYNAVSAWMQEASSYNYNNPTFSTYTAHFTQVVWKSVTQIACAKATCSGSFIVCLYTPAGNVQGQYAQNVGRRV